MSESMLDKVRGVLLLAAAAIAFISVFMAVYEALYQRIGSARLRSADQVAKKNKASGTRLTCISLTISTL